MRFEDKNQTLVPPEGYIFRNAVSDGAYMKLTYYQPVYKTDSGIVLGDNVVTIYLNDQGREVGRCIGSVRFPQPEPPSPVDAAFARTWQFRWLRFKSGFLLTLQGIGEMLKCLN